MKQICSRTACVMGKAALAAPRSSPPGNAQHSTGCVGMGFVGTTSQLGLCVWVCTQLGLREQILDTRR